MIICPTCQYKNIDGTMFCEDCGSQITGMEMDTHTIKTDQIKPTLGATTDFVDTPPRFDTWGSLHLIESGQILPLGDRNEFTLGRISDAQPIMPDIDLTPYQAYANGVSRLHVVLKRNGKKISVIDLGSSNGTYLNSERLKPNIEVLVKNNDILSLGKLKIQVLINY